MLQFTQVVSPLSMLSSSSYAYVIGDKSNTSFLNVTLSCDRSALYDQSNLVSLTSSQQFGSMAAVTTWYTAIISTSAVCPVRQYFCNVDADCSSQQSGNYQRCVQGVCVDVSCLSLSLDAFLSTGPANVLSKFTAADCLGQPVRNLGLDNFTVTLDGEDITGPTFAGEVPSILLPSTASVVVLTTLLLDQSASVVNGFESNLVDAAIVMIQTLINASASSSNQQNLVAVLLFDGASDTTTLMAHTTNLSAVVDALRTLPVTTPDRSSTNLYGAIISGLAASISALYSIPNSSVGAANVVLFTDGYDTAGRKTRGEALGFAKAYSSNVTVMSIGMTNSSDAAFLAAVSTSGYYVSSSISTLSSTFSDLAKHILYATQDVYLLLMCLPMRSGVINVSVSLSLNSNSTYSASGISYLVNASSFSGGCSVPQLISQAANSTQFSFRNTTATAGGNTSVTAQPAMPPPQSFQLLAPNAAAVAVNVSTSMAYFANTSCPTGFACRLLATGSATTVYVLNSTRCFLSPYCRDFVLTSGVGDLAGGATYLMMVVASISSSPVPVMLSVTYVTPAPTMAPTTATPATASPALSIGLASGTGEVDNAAVIVFVVFAILVGFGIAVCLIVHWITPANQTFRSQLPSASSGWSMQKPAISPLHGGGNSSSKNLHKMSEEMGEVPLLFPTLQEPGNASTAAASVRPYVVTGSSPLPASPRFTKQPTSDNNASTAVIHHSRGGSTVGSPNVSFDMSGAYTAPYSPPQQVIFTSGVVSQGQPYRERNGIFSPKLIRQTASVYPKSNVDDL